MQGGQTNRNATTVADLKLPNNPYSKSDPLRLVGVVGVVGVIGIVGAVGVVGVVNPYPAREYQMSDNC